MDIDDIPVAARKRILQTAHAVVREFPGKPSDFRLVEIADRCHETTDAVRIVIRSTQKGAA